MARLVSGVIVVLALAVVAVGVAYGMATPAPAATTVRVTGIPAAPSAPRLHGTWPRPKRKPRPPQDFVVADAVGPTAALYEAPGVPLAAKPVLDNPTWEGLPVVFLVKEDKGDWLHVQVSMRPNGAMAWVPRSEVALRKVPNRIVVELAARRVTVLHGSTVVLQEPVAVGRDGAPTPTGDFFVDGVVKVSNPNGPYGAYQVSVAAFSDVYQRFGVGIGQIALHGTNQPQLLGQGVSHGCVRMTNDTITRVVALAPLGTPVSILP